jgi:hypothetical protein
MKIIRTGCTRIVIIAFGLAFKIPNFIEGYRLFLWGLLNNHNEVGVYKFKDTRERVCPIFFHLPLGLLVVMPKVDILTDTDFLSYHDDIDKLWRVNENCVIPCELKSDSFGYYKGKIVVVDYGS